jgi:hypothetical protein
LLNGPGRGAGVDRLRRRPGKKFCY